MIRMDVEVMKIHGLYLIFLKKTRHDPVKKILNKRIDISVCRKGYPEK
jgi:hypothetical protein